MITVAAIYVAKGGAYWNIPGVDPWDESRDARKYDGPHPVVAHPPCSRWCRLAGPVQARWGYKKGDDGGCFAAALASVRKWGGVLEHPAYSDAFAKFDLPIPRPGGWQRGLCGGWSCHVEQWHYGHKAKKATWLYAFGASHLPSLVWGITPDTAAPAHVTDGGGDVNRRRVTAFCEGQNARKANAKRARANVSWCGNHVKDGEDRERLGKKAANATPPAFRDLLLSIARSCR